MKKQMRINLSIFRSELYQTDFFQSLELEIWRALDNMLGIISCTARVAENGTGDLWVLQSFVDSAEFCYSQFVDMADMLAATDPDDLTTP